MSVFENLQGTTVNRARTALLNPKSSVIRELEGDSIIDPTFTDITRHPDADYLTKVLFSGGSRVIDNLYADMYMKAVKANPVGEVYLKLLEPNSTLRFEEDKWVHLYNAGRITLEDLDFNLADKARQIYEGGIGNRNYGLPNEEPFTTFKELTKTTCACKSIVGAVLLLISSNIYASQ